jgi:signal transduction histidine kinase/ligand-binding sensor domain-containing protein
VRHSVVLTGTLPFIVLAWCACAFALNPDRDIHQLAHRSWGEREGYPGRSEALAQTADGFLWIGSDIGLFRFDGVHFERYVPRSGDKLSKSPVHSLLALPDGSLWIGYGFENKICLLRNGNVKCYGKADGVASYPCALVQDREGTMWANTWNGLIRFSGTRWEHIGRDWNFPEDVPHITSTVLFVDSHGTLWAGVHQTMLCLKQGSKRFESTGVYAGWSLTMAEASDGTLWFPDNKSYVRAVSRSVSAKSAAIAKVAKCEVLAHRGAPAKCPSEIPPVVEISSANGVFVDRNQGLWITTDTSGLVRIPHPERLKDRVISKTSDALQKFASKDGLGADDCSFVLEDREGNIWVATRDGLDQFRDTALVPVALPTSLFRVGIAPAGGGDIWVNGSWNYVARIHGDSRNLSFMPADAFKPYRDPAGVTWLMGDSLAQWKDGRFRKVALSPDGLAGSWGTWQVAGDGFGKLWAFSTGHGFFFLDHGRWKAWATPPELAKQRVADMFSDSTGRIWVSTVEGDIITLDKGNVVDHPVKPDSPLRNVKVFAERAPQEIWTGGTGGLVLIDNGHFRPIKPALDSFEDVTGIVDAGGEGLWLNTENGVIHIPRVEADRALRDGSYRFKFERVDSPEGLPGQTETLNPYPKAIQGTDGRIWFTVARGLAWIDPKKKISTNALPPPVDIERIVADGKDYEASNKLQLPPHVRDLSIDYTALSLAVPEKVHFRYKLEGQDPDWREVVNDREVQYSNLAPRHYTFRVIACNNSGVWNEAGAALDFSVAPAWYQTNWFRVACAATLLMLLYLLYQLRLRQLHHQFSIGLEARVNERTRIARELHDTLLQSVQGLMLRFQTVGEMLPARPLDAKNALEGALDRADQAISEGRDAITDIRASSLVSRDLEKSITALMTNLSEELAAGNERSVTFRVLVEGVPRAVRPTLQDEIYRIARESLRNAFRHAQAGHIETEIMYGESLRLRFRDDGKGMDPSVVKHGGRSGHWGLPGIRERAKQIGAHLAVWSELGAGTEVELNIPGSIAYEVVPGTRFRIFRKRTEQDHEHRS